MADEKVLDIETKHASLEPHEPKLEVPPVTWWKEPGLRHLYLMMPILFLGSTINGYDGSLLNGLQTMEQWRSYFGYPTGAELGLFTAIQNVGAVCALPFSSYLADLFGRRIGVEVGITLIFLGVIIQSVPSVNEGMFIGGRFLVGFGSNLSQGSAPLLIMEVSSGLYREPWYDCTDCIPIACPSPTPRQDHDHVQHFVVCRLYRCRVDRVWYDRLHRQRGLESARGATSSYAAHTICWDMAVA